MELTKKEIEYIINLIEDNEHDGSYYGNSEKYWKMVRSVKDKLRNTIKSDCILGAGKCDNCNNIPGNYPYCKLGSEVE